MSLFLEIIFKTCSRSVDDKKSLEFASTCWFQNHFLRLHYLPFETTNVFSFQNLTPMHGLVTCNMSNIWLDNRCSKSQKTKTFLKKSSSTNNYTQQERVNVSSLYWLFHTQQ